MDMQESDSSIVLRDGRAAHIGKGRAGRLLSVSAVFDGPGKALTLAEG